MPVPPNPETPADPVLRRILKPVTCLIAVAAGCLALAVWFVEASRTYYFWDHRFYHQLAVDTWLRLQESPRQMLGFVRWSLDWDINALYTLPLLPVFALFGTDRSVYIAGLVMLYLLPYALLCGWVGAVVQRSRGGFPPAVLFALLLPPVWLPTLVGYPDSLAATALALAIVVYCRDPELRRTGSVVALGLALAASVLLRRHFGYPVAAFCAAAVLTHAVLHLGRPERGWRELAGMPLRLAGAVAIALALMLALAPEFTLRALYENYSAIYASYRLPAAEIVQYIADGFGRGILLLALLGYALAWWRGPGQRRLLLFLLLLAGLWLLVWAGWVRQRSPQYPLHVLPLVTAVGLGLLLHAIRYRWMKSVLVLLLGLNFAQAMLLYNSPLAASAPARLLARAHGVLSAPVMLLREHAEDYALYQALVDHLRELSPPGGKVYVAASHGRLNDDVIRSVEDELYGFGREPIDLLPNAHVDSRDFLPLSQLLQADIVLVARPFQHHLPAAEQDVVRVVLDVFDEDWPLSEDFKPLPRRFVFSGGMTITLYRRLRPTTMATAIDTLRRMRHQVEVPGNLQSGWLPVGPSFASQASGAPGGPSRLTLRTGTRQTTDTLVYYHEVAGIIRLEGQLYPEQCAGFELLASSRDAQLKSEARARYALGARQPLKLEFHSAAPVALALRLQSPATSGPGGECRLSIRELRVAADNLD